MFYFNHDVYNILFNWFIHFTQIYILLRCKEDSSNFGTTISDTMIFPYFNNRKENTKYDYMAFFSLHFTFMIFLFNVMTIFFNIDIKNEIIDQLIKVLIISSVSSITALYFTCIYTDDNKNLFLHYIITVIIIINTYILSLILTFNFLDETYIDMTYVHIIALVFYFTVIVISYTIFGQKYTFDNVLHIGELEIFIFVFVYNIILMYNEYFNATHFNSILFLNIALIVVLGSIIYTFLNKYRKLSFKYHLIMIIFVYIVYFILFI